jgi:hypothetical protein
MIWQSDTQPLQPLFSYQNNRRNGTIADTFVAYLQRHSLTTIAAARTAARPSSLVWRVTKWLPISEANAWALVSALALVTGETFGGLILTVRDDTRPKATRFLV